MPHKRWSGSDRREVPGSFRGRPYRSNRSEFSVDFSETLVSAGWDPLERPPRRTLPLQAQVPQADSWPLSYNPNQLLIFCLTPTYFYLHLIC